MRVEPREGHGEATLRGLQGLLERQHPCDVVLRSRDGEDFHLHRVLLASASEPLFALLCGQFSESRSSAVQLDTSQGVMSVLVAYIYGKAIDIAPEDGPEALRLAHMYGLSELQAMLTEVIAANLDVQCSMWLLNESESLLVGIPDLEECCERYLVEHFEACVRNRNRSAFNSLSAPQLGRLLEHVKITPAVVWQKSCTWSGTNY
jgi:hypothetical protein